MIDNQYETLLKKIMDTGVDRGDRTGVGTRSIFGQQLRYDLSRGFPAITTKKLHFRSIIHELLWFLSGDTNIGYLHDNKVTIWDEWADENGDLGSVYGSQWRYMPCQNIGNMNFKEYDIRITKDTEEYPPLDFHPGKIRNEDLIKKYDVVTDRDKRLLSIWINMHRAAAISKIFKVQPVWNDFNRFKRTVTKVPMYAYWLQSPDSYELNPNYWGNGVYSPSTCVFVPTLLHFSMFLEPRSCIKYQGKYYINEDHYRLVNNTTLYPRNSEVVYFPEGKVIRPQLFVDQIEDLVEGLKNNPNSRRHIICAWNPTEIENQALPPCHSFVQFYVADGRLSGLLYQRSVDSGLGLPYNIASYSILIHMLAQQCELEVGEFVWNGGDCHIYKNHIEPLSEQITRESRDLPQLLIKRKPDSIFDYKFEDFEIAGYDPHPAIKMQIAV